ncbi:MAG: hypothetical protein SFW62_09020 [Alphaproteobacteria bacterium]|nr:hypothetical protein [Alphaproteobacteria bacterium]
MDTEDTKHLWLLLTQISQKLDDVKRALGWIALLLAGGIGYMIAASKYLHN